MGADAYHERMGALQKRAKACPKAEGFDEILTPGEGEKRNAAKGRRDGLALSAADLAILREEAAAIETVSLVLA